MFVSIKFPQAQVLRKKHKFMKKTLLISIVVLLAFSFSLQAAEKGIVRVNTDLSKRVALIIGNSDYSAAVGPLRNPVNDARTMAEALEEVGFKVTRLENVKYREMREAVRDFGRKLRKSDAALFYFSGHGVQFEGGNYLLPIGAEIEIPRHISYEALSENEVLAEMEGGTKDRVNLVIVDACRNNLVTRGFRSASKGLAQPEFHPSGSLIAYATAPGKVAADGTGANSPYVAELSKHLRTPGLKVEDVFKRVLVGVEERTKGKQVPWVNASLKGDFYFVPPEEKPELADNYEHQFHNLVIIDESHHFRRHVSNQYKNIKRYLDADENRKVLLLTATPFGVSYDDLFNQIKLFHKTDRTEIPIGTESFNMGDLETELTYKVSGVFEIPGAVSYASKHHSPKAVITLGVVIKGETPHFDFISSACANSISKLTIKKKFPITFGVLTTNTYKQALKRAQQKGVEIADATILSINTYQQIKSK